mgnify:CR=1 FL=1
MSDVRLSIMTRLAVVSFIIGIDEDIMDFTHNDIGFVFERSENMKQSVVLPQHE